MIRCPSWTPIRPSTRIARPGPMPAIRRRPSQTSVSAPEPSYSSASSAGTPPRGRSVTVRRSPWSWTSSRSGASAIVVRPDVRLDAAQVAGVLVGAVGPLADAAPQATLLRHGEILGRIRNPAGSFARRSGSTIGSGSADRHRVVTPAYDDLGEHVLPRPGGLGRGRGPAHQRGAQEPAGAVDPDHAGGLTGGLAVGLLHRALADQLGPEAALPLGDGAAPPLDVGGDLAAAPRSRGPRCGAPRRRAARGRRRVRRPGPPARPGWPRRPAPAPRDPASARSAGSRGRPGRRPRRSTSESS